VSVTSEVLAVVLMKIHFLVVTLCEVVNSSWCFGGGKCLYFLGQAAKK